MEDLKKKRRELVRLNKKLQRQMLFKAEKDLPILQAGSTTGKPNKLARKNALIEVNAVFYHIINKKGQWSDMMILDGPRISAANVNTHPCVYVTIHHGGLSESALMAPAFWKKEGMLRKLTRTERDLAKLAYPTIVLPLPLSMKYSTYRWDETIYKFYFPWIWLIGAINMTIGMLAMFLVESPKIWFINTLIAYTIFAVGITGTIRYPKRRSREKGRGQ